jgi:hypothetical protein
MTDGSTPRYVRFAVPEILCSLNASHNFDRCTNSSSLLHPPGALGFVPASIPLHSLYYIGFLSCFISFCGLCPVFISVRLRNICNVYKRREAYYITKKFLLQQFFENSLIFFSASLSKNVDLKILICYINNSKCFLISY